MTSPQHKSPNPFIPATILELTRSFYRETTGHQCHYCMCNFGSKQDLNNHMKKDHHYYWGLNRQAEHCILPSEKSDVFNNGFQHSPDTKPLGGFTTGSVLNWLLDPDFSEFGHSFKESGRYTVDGWYFPGQGGTPYATCGTLHYKGCLNPAHAGQAAARKIIDNCARSTCPICHDQWLIRTAKKIEHRIEAYAAELSAELGRGYQRRAHPIHVTANPPPELWNAFKDIKNFNKLRKNAQKYVVEAGFTGGTVIYHQKRERCGDCGGKILFKEKKCADCGAYNIVWYFSPHFHFIGFGYINVTKDSFKGHGWVIVNHGIRNTVYGTAFYQLTHCSIHEGKHTLVWFGALHYSKYRLETESICEADIASNECPLCGNKLRLLRYYGNKPPPIGEGVNIIDSAGWEYRN